MVRAPAIGGSSSVAIASTPAPPAFPAKSHAVASFLKEIGLFQYVEALLRTGFDDMETLVEIEDCHMKDLGIPPGHVLKLKKRLREYKSGQVDAKDSQSPQQQQLLHQGHLPSGSQTQSAPGESSGDQQTRSGDTTGGAQGAAGAATSGAAACPIIEARRRFGEPTAEMLAMVKRSWEQIVACGSTVLGELLFRNLFRLNAEALQFFAFRGEANIYDSPAFHEVCSQLVGDLHSALAQPQAAGTTGTPIVQRLVVGPLSLETMQQLIDTLGQALILTVKAGLRDNFSQEMEVAWTCVFGNLAASMLVAGRDCPETESPQCHVGLEVEGGREVYKIEDHLQKAIFGDVWKAVGLSSGRRFAVKVVDLGMVRQLRQSQDNQLCETPLCEVRYNEMMEGLEHVAQMEEHFGDQLCHYVVSELALGGDLLEALKQRPGGLYERQAQVLVRQAAKGLCSLHERGLAMQDVSLENMLLYVKGEGEWQVRLCDPGQAVPLVFDTATGAEAPTDFQGFVAKQFRPPELYTKRSYLATKVDSWCLGWSTFYLLVAQPMFHSADPAVHDPDWILFQRRVFSKLFQQKGWRTTLSHQAKDFILRLMQIDPDQRMSLKQALRHPWLAEDVVQQPVFDKETVVAKAPSEAPERPSSGASRPNLHINIASALSVPDASAPARKQAEASPCRSSDGETEDTDDAERPRQEAQRQRPRPLTVEELAIEAAAMIAAPKNTPMGHLAQGGGGPMGSGRLVFGNMGLGDGIRPVRPSRSLSPGPVDSFPMNMQTSDWCQPATQPPSPQEAMPSPAGSEMSLAPRQMSYKLTEGVKRVLQEVEEARRPARGGMGTVAALELPPQPTKVEEEEEDVCSGDAAAGRARPNVVSVASCAASTGPAPASCGAEVAGGVASRQAPQEAVKAPQPQQPHAAHHIGAPTLLSRRAVNSSPPPSRSRDIKVVPVIQHFPQAGGLSYQASRVRTQR